MAYVDGYLIPIKKSKLKSYKKMAQIGKRMWMRNGALAYVEPVADDLKVFAGMPFTKLARAKAGETVILAFVTYKSKAHRNLVNARVMKDPAMGKGIKEIPFDMKRMAFGGFKVLVKG